MDGNVRWSKKKKVDKNEGYKKGLDKIKEIIELCIENKVKFLTLFALSSENIQRPSVNIIFDIIVNNFESFLEYISIKNDVKVNVFGNKYGLKKNIKKIIETIEINTKENSQLFLNVALNYGAKNEIVYCFNNLLNNKNIKNTVINEKIIRENLYLPNTPDPDILIRTGGFQRLSNFLLFQLSYTELFFTKTLWPEISKKEILNIFYKYKTIERKFGI